MQSHCGNPFVRVLLLVPSERARAPRSTLAAVAAGLWMACTATAQVRVTEYMYTGSGVEYVELTNFGAGSVDVTGWSIDDSHRVAGFIPIGALASILPGESVILAGGSAEDFRTNWGLAPSSKVLGETGTGGHDLGRNDEINVYDGNGNLVDRLTYGDQTFPGSPRANSVSAWVQTEGIGINDCLLWSLSAPGDVQDSWLGVSGDLGSPGGHTLGVDPGVTPPPVLSHAAGYYEHEFDLTVVSPSGGTVVHYTLDGTVPGASSALLQPSIHISSRTGEPNVHCLIPSCPSELWQTPTTEVFKVVVVRAVAIRDDGVASEPVTRTYLVGPGVRDRYVFPVISIVTEPDHMFGFENGIYVPGRIYEENYDPAVLPHNRVANYTQDGSLWERPAYLQFFEADQGLAFEQSVSLRINGGVSRSFQQKSLRVYADSQPGTSGITHPIFGENSPPLQRRLILRNAGNDNVRALCRDDLMHSLVTDTGVDTQASRFAIVFVNGEYWGIHSIRERYDKYYLQARHGVDPDNVDYLESYGLLAANVKEGDRVHYTAMINFMHGADLTNDASIAELETYMDLDNFLTYFAIEIYSANYDWPANNIEYWRPRTPDGRWRWMLKDTDLGFNWGTLSTPSTNSVARLVNDTSWATDIFRSVLQNQRVKERFLNRMADLLNTTFKPERVQSRIEEFRGMLAPHIPEHIARWNLPSTMAVWSSQMNTMGTFAAQRPGFVRQHVVNSFSLAGTSSVSVACDHPAVSELVVNSLRLPSGDLPFAGEYFRGVPIRVSVEIPAGYCDAVFYGAPASGVLIGGDTLVFDPQEEVSISVRLVRSADVNGDGGIDGADVSDFFDVWDAGDPSGDFNEDGGVDGSDVSDFFVAWEGGRC